MRQFAGDLAVIGLAIGEVDTSSLGMSRVRCCMMRVQITLARIGEVPPEERHAQRDSDVS